MSIMKCKYFPLVVFSFLFCFACGDGGQTIYNPKPRSYPKIEFPTKDFTQVNSEVCPFTFQRASYANFVRDTLFFNEKPENDCWFDLFVPSLNGTIHCSYYEINKENSLDKLITEHIHSPTSMVSKLNSSMTLWSANRIGCLET